jgi:peroxiredoxin
MENTTVPLTKNLKGRLLYLLLLILILGIVNDCSTAAVKKGDTAPDFLGETLDGQKVYLSNHKGKIVLLTFWAAWCEYCKNDLKDLEAMQYAYPPDEFVSFAVNIGETPGIVQTYVKNITPNLSVLTDQQGKVFSSYGKIGVPLIILINKQGQVHWTNIGYRYPERIKVLKQEIQGLLGGK